MKRRNPFRFALALCASCVTSATHAQQPAPARSATLEATVRLGAPAARQRIVVEPAPEGGVVLVAGTLREPLPLASAVAVDAQAVELAPGRFVAVVRVRGTEGAEAGVVLERAGRTVRSRFTAPLDPRGDRGERRWSSLEVQAAQQGQPARVVVADYADRVRVCGESATPLRSRQLDLVTGAWQPVATPMLAAGRGVESVVPVAQLEGLVGAPLVPALRVQGVSSERGAEADKGAHAGRLLTDGDLASAWIASSGTGEVATFAVESGGLPLRALALTLAAAPDGAVLARSWLLIGDEGPALRAQLPEAAAPGARYFVPLPEGRAWRCLAVVADDAGVSDAKRETLLGLAEVDAYTELDFQGGLDRLVDQMAREGAEGARAVDLLVRVGPAVVQRLTQRWSTLSSVGRARAVRVLAVHAVTSEQARAGLAVALGDADPDVRKQATKALLAADGAGHAVLAQHIAAPTELGDEAAIELAAEAPTHAVGAILPALEASGDTRPELRAALTVACDRGGSAALDVLRAWTEREQSSLPARALVAQALSKCRASEDVRALTTSVVERAVVGAERFEDRWRLVAASERAGESAVIDDFLARLAREEERWMLREAALRALAVRNEARARALASAALRDDYPRVRATAAQLLAKEPAAREALSTHARRDHWPMVRAAALQSLAGQPSSREVLEAGVRDRAKSVRAAAIRALAAAGARSAWSSSIEPKLRDLDEWPEVVSAAMDYARELCVTEAAPLLLERLRRGLAPGAHQVDADLVMPAFEALLALGGEPARQALSLANSSSAPAGLRALAKRRVAGAASCPRAAE